MDISGNTDSSLLKGVGSDSSRRDSSKRDRPEEGKSAVSPVQIGELRGRGSGAIFRSEDGEAAPKVRPTEGEGKGKGANGGKGGGKGRGRPRLGGNPRG